MSDELNVVRLQLRPFHQRFIRSYRGWRSFGLSVTKALRAAWMISRSWSPLWDIQVPQACACTCDPMRDQQAPTFNFDAWMRERVESAHKEFMSRTSHLPPCARRTYSADEIAKFYGISHGGID